MSPNRTKILGIIILIIAIVAGLVVFKSKVKTNYSVVDMINGDVYVGKLTTFPTFELTDAYILQVAKDATDPNKNTFQLNPVNQALWAPKSIHIVKDNVIFYGELTDGSKLAQTIASQAK